MKPKCVECNFSQKCKCASEKQMLLISEERYNQMREKLLELRQVLLLLTAEENE